MSNSIKKWINYDHLRACNIVSDDYWNGSAQDYLLYALQFVHCQLNSIYCENQIVSSYPGNDCMENYFAIYLHGPYESPLFPIFPRDNDTSFP